MRTPIEVILNPAGRCDASLSTNFIPTLKFFSLSNYLMTASILDNAGVPDVFDSGTEFYFAIDSDLNVSTTPLVQTFHAGFDMVDGKLTWNIALPDLSNLLGGNETASAYLILWARPSGEKPFVVWQDENCVFQNCFVPIISIPFPEQATRVSPTAEATPDPAQDITLEWSCVLPHTGFDVWIDSTLASADQSGTSFLISANTFSTSQEISWQVDSRNLGKVTNGASWTFTTAAPAIETPAQTVLVSPLSTDTPDATNDFSLEWSCSAPYTGFDVWLNSSKVSANQAGTSYLIAANTLGTSASTSWRVDSINETQTTTGNAWTFTTAAPVAPPAELPATIFSSGSNISVMNQTWTLNAGSGGVGQSTSVPFYYTNVNNGIVVYYHSAGFWYAYGSGTEYFRGSTNPADVCGTWYDSGSVNTPPVFSTTPPAVRITGPSYPWGNSVAGDMTMYWNATNSRWEWLAYGSTWTYETNGNHYIIDPDNNATLLMTCDTPLVGAMTNATSESYFDGCTSQYA
jgi:hypothetical protein